MQIVHGPDLNKPDGENQETGAGWIQGSIALRYGNGRATILGLNAITAFSAVMDHCASGCIARVRPRADAPRTNEIHMELGRIKHGFENSCHSLE